MNSETQDNLEELFGKFIGSEQAGEMAEDVRKGERILGEYSAPEPDQILISDIKAEIAEALLHRGQTSFRRMAYRAMAVAAVIAVLAAVSVKLFENDGGKPKTLISASLVPAAIWESDNIAEADVELSTLIAELEQVEDEILALQSGQVNGNGNKAVTELELELIEINSDFWKG